MQTMLEMVDRSCVAFMWDTRWEITASVAAGSRNIAMKSCQHTVISTRDLLLSILDIWNEDLGLHASDILKKLKGEYDVRKISANGCPYCIVRNRPSHDTDQS